MAQRARRKSKRQAPPPRQRAGRAAPVETERADAKPNGQVARLELAEHERDQLKAQLAEAQAIDRQAQQARDEAVNRIDWAIDSLHNVLESDA